MWSSLLIGLLIAGAVGFCIVFLRQTRRIRSNTERIGGQNQELQRQEERIRQQDEQVRGQSEQIASLKQALEKLATEETCVFDFLHGLGEAFSADSRRGDLH